MTLGLYKTPLKLKVCSVLNQSGSRSSTAQDLAPVCMEADTNSWIFCNTKDIEKSVFYTEGFSSPCSLLFIQTIWHEEAPFPGVHENCQSKSPNKTLPWWPSQTHSTECPPVSQYKCWRRKWVQGKTLSDLSWWKGQDNSLGIMETRVDNGANKWRLGLRQAQCRVGTGITVYDITSI